MRSSTVVNVMPGWRDMSDGVVHLRDQQAETQILGSTFPPPSLVDPSPLRRESWHAKVDRKRIYLL